MKNERKLMRKSLQEEEKIDVSLSRLTLVLGIVSVIFFFKAYWFIYKSLPLQESITDILAIFLFILSIVPVSFLIMKLLLKFISCK